MWVDLVGGVQTGTMLWVNFLRCGATSGGHTDGLGRPTTAMAGELGLLQEKRWKRNGEAFSKIEISRSVVGGTPSSSPQKIWILNFKTSLLDFWYHSIEIKEWIQTSKAEGQRYDEGSDDGESDEERPVEVEFPIEDIYVI